jgi:membrane-associated phospholipid phosphatase
MLDLSMFCIVPGGRMNGQMNTTTADQSVVSTSFLKMALLPVLLLLAALFAHSWDTRVSDAVRAGSSVAGYDLQQLKAYTDYFRGFGKGDVLVMLAFLVGLCGFKQRAVAIICALIVTALLVWPLKVTVHRERPRGNSFVSFPSGDAASAAAFAQVTASGTPLLIPVAIVMATSVSAGRVLVLAHYGSDVLAGSALGVVAGLIGLRISRRYPLPVLRQRYFFLLFFLYVAGNLVYCSLASKQNEITRFLEMYGLVIYPVVVGRLVYILYGKFRNNRVPSVWNSE